LASGAIGDVPLGRGSLGSAQAIVNPERERLRVETRLVRRSMAVGRAHRVLVISLSYRTIPFGFLALGTAEHGGQVERSHVVGDRREALCDLRLVETVRSEPALDAFTDRSSCTRELPGRRRLAFSKQAAGLGQREFLCIVASEAQPVARVESRQRLA
jgi:hypothetical protein